MARRRSLARRAGVRRPQGHWKTSDKTVRKAFPISRRGWRRDRDKVVILAAQLAELLGSANSLLSIEAATPTGLNLVLVRREPRVSGTDDLGFLSVARSPRRRSCGSGACQHPHSGEFDSMMSGEITCPPASSFLIELMEDLGAIRLPVISGQFLLWLKSLDRPPSPYHVINVTSAR